MWAWTRGGKTGSSPRLQGGRQLSPGEMPYIPPATPQHSNNGAPAANPWAGSVAAPHQTANVVHVESLLHAELAACGHHARYSSPSPGALVSRSLMDGWCCLAGACPTQALRLTCQLAGVPVGMSRGQAAQLAGYLPPDNPPLDPAAHWAPQAAYSMRGDAVTPSPGVPDLGSFSAPDSFAAYA